MERKKGAESARVCGLKKSHSVGRSGGQSNDAIRQALHVSVKTVSSGAPVLKEKAWMPYGKGRKERSKPSRPRPILLKMINKERKS